ncbi:hypothetical protein AGMMS50229_09370 [Campylobacterota bacterium]|nr:hypothetical protein AGMMS50229_09370 [Campylobacterota bacterium]
MKIEELLSTLQEILDILNDAITSDEELYWEAKAERLRAQILAMHL